MSVPTIADFIASRLLDDAVIQPEHHKRIEPYLRKLLSKYSLTIKFSQARKELVVPICLRALWDAFIACFVRCEEAPAEDSPALHLLRALWASDGHLLIFDLREETATPKCPTATTEEENSPVPEKLNLQASPARTQEDGDQQAALGGSGGSPVKNSQSLDAQEEDQAEGGQSSVEQPEDELLQAANEEKEALAEEQKVSSEMNLEEVEVPEQRDRLPHSQQAQHPRAEGRALGERNLGAEWQPLMPEDIVVQADDRNTELRLASHNVFFEAETAASLPTFIEVQEPADEQYDFPSLPDDEDLVEKFGNRCFNCGNYGHWNRSCPFPREGPFYGRRRYQFR